MPYNHLRVKSKNTKVQVKVDIGDNMARWGNLRKELKVSNVQLATILLDNYHPPDKRTMDTQTEKIYTSPAITQTNVVIPTNQTGEHFKEFKYVITNSRLNRKDKIVSPFTQTEEHFKESKNLRTYSRLPRKDVVGKKVVPSLLMGKANVTTVSDPNVGKIVSNALTANLCCQTILDIGTSAKEVEILSNYLNDFGIYARNNFVVIVEAILEKMATLPKNLDECTNLVEIFNCLISNGYNPAYEKVKEITAYEICGVIETKGFPLPINALERNKNLRRAYENLITTLWANNCQANKLVVGKLNCLILNHVMDCILRILSHLMNFHIKVRKSSDGELKFDIEKCVSKAVPVHSSTKPNSSKKLGLDRPRFSRNDVSYLIPDIKVKTETSENSEPPVKVIKTELLSNYEPDAILPDF